MQVGNCPFCYIKADEAVVLETPNVLVLCDIRPVTLGHVLVLPKQHVASVLDIPIELSDELALVQQEIAARLVQALGEVGVYEHGRTNICRFHDRWECQDFCV